MSLSSRWGLKSKIANRRLSLGVEGWGGVVSGSEGLGTQGPTVNTQALCQLWIFPEFIDLFTESVSPFSVATVCQIPGIRNDQEQ